MLYCIPYQDISKEQWNTFVENNKSAWYYHTTYFIDAWSVHGENVSFCIIDENRDILLEQPLYLNRSFRSYFSSLGGPAWRDDLREKEVKTLRKYYKDCIESKIKEYRVDVFKYTICGTLTPKYLPSCCPMVNPLIYWGYENTISQSVVLDLQKETREIFSGFRQNTRNLIRRCEKKNIRIITARPNGEDLEKYYRLHEETYQRTGVLPRPKEYFKHIFLEMIPKGYSRVLFAYQDNELVAAQNTLIYKDCAMYWTGASGSERDDGINRLLCWLQIIYAKEKGCKYYEVGEIHPNTKDEKMRGLTIFKNGFGGMIHPIFSGAWLSESKYEVEYLPPLNKLDINDRIIIHGAGKVGDSYYRTLRRLGYQISGWSDKKFGEIINNEEIISPEKAIAMVFDKLLIAVSDDSVANDIKNDYINRGVKREKIIFETPL